MPTLADLPDDARVLIVPIDPPVADFAALLAGVDKLFAQFVREGRLSVWAAEAAADGALLVIGYVSDELSGCAKDTFGKFLLRCEEVSGSRLVNAAPVPLALPGGTRFCDRTTLRQMLSAETISAATLVHNLRAASLGEWRSRSVLPLSQSWLASLVALQP